MYNKGIEKYVLYYKVREKGNNEWFNAKRKGMKNRKKLYEKKKANARKQEQIQVS